MEERITYFERPGRENTTDVLRMVKEKARERGIKKIVLASTRGDAARTAAESFEGTGIQLVVVPWQYGFRDKQPFSQELVVELHNHGHRVHFGTMLFHTEEFYGIKTPQVMANLLRIFSQGIKVCVEITRWLVTEDALKKGKESLPWQAAGLGQIRQSLPPLPRAPI